MTDEQLKVKCDQVANEVLDLINSKGKELNLETRMLVVVAFGTAIALAIATGFKADEVRMIVEGTLEDIGLG